MNLFTIIKERVPILDIITEHTVLKKLGNYWKGQCPFHSERTASFAVSPHRAMFYCFGCQVTGDVISFISKIDNCSQLEAAKQLADRYNIDIPESAFNEPTINRDEKKQYFSICNFVAQWAHKQLAKYPAIGSYLTQRHLTPKSLESFCIGYFPAGEKAIKDLLKEASYESFLAEDLIHAGILNEGKSLYSPFEDRLLFPIKDHLGNYCGFGGRIVSEHDQRSKYYNSKENALFQKGSILFGLDKAKKEIQKTGNVFLVEGYTDCIAMAQHGYTNTVATLGTACTLEHLKLLAHHAHTMYVMYDNDTAGQKATIRLAHLSWEVNLEIKVITLPNAKDPAAFFEHNEDLNLYVTNAQDILQFFLVSLGKEYAQQPLTLKLQATRSFLECIKKLSDPLKKEILLQRASQIFDLPIQSLKHEISIQSHSQKTPPTQPIISTEVSEISTLEKNFLCAIINRIDLLEKTQVKDLLEYIPEPFKAIMSKLQALATQENTQQLFTTFFDTLEEHEKIVINQILFTQEEENYDFEQTVLLLEKKYWKKIVSVTKQKLARAQETHDLERVKAIVESFLELKKRLLHKGLI